MLTSMDLEVSPICAMSTNWNNGSSFAAFVSLFMALTFGEALLSADLFAMAMIPTPLGETRFGKYCGGVHHFLGAAYLQCHEGLELKSRLSRLKPREIMKFQQGAFHKCHTFFYPPNLIFSSGKTPTCKAILGSRPTPMQLALYTCRDAKRHRRPRQ